MPNPVHDPEERDARQFLPKTDASRAVFSDAR